MKNHRNSVLSFVCILALTTGVAFGAKKKESEVTKALTKAYPDAKTEITGNHQVNGVAVYNVKVTTKDGDSTAEITDYGDFLMYGVPHDVSVVRNDITKSTAGLFKTAPQDIDMYRVTNYWVDLTGPAGKTISARFDAVGRLKDIMNAGEVERTRAEKNYGAAVTGDDAKKAEDVVKKELPDAQVQGVYKANEGDNFLNVQIKNGQAIVNTQGQVYSFNEEVDKSELPEPIAATIKSIFGDEKIQKVSRGEYEYYQFDQQSPSGEAIVVKMRPNGDIIEVRNDKAREEDQAMTAKHKAKASSKVNKSS